MTIKAAFDELAKLSVTGVTRNFYGSTVPGVIGSAQLPCKITLLDNTDRSAAEAEGPVERGKCGGGGDGRGRGVTWPRSAWA